MSHSQNKIFFHFVAKIFDFVEKICYNIVSKKYIIKKKGYPYAKYLYVQ